MRKRSLALFASGVVMAMAAMAAPALASNVSHPATYTGPAATGGTIEFDVSADGSAVTRFAVKNVATTCGTIESTTTGTIPIVNDSFSNNSGIVRFAGTFHAIQQAQGTVSFQSFGIFGCTSQPVSWTATTPTPPPDETPPNTKIKSGPSGTTDKEKATFRFASTEAGSTFQCKLDRKPWRSCKSPKTYRNLNEGKHTFKVKAKDQAGNVDPTPAKRTWRVELD